MFGLEKVHLLLGSYSSGCFDWEEQGGAGGVKERDGDGGGGVCLLIVSC